MRGLYSHLYPTIPVRLNALAPSWTDTAIAPRALLEPLGIQMQSPTVVSHATALLMADETRHGQLIYCENGLYREVEEPILEATRRIAVTVGVDKPNFEALRATLVDKAPVHQTTAG
jgi:hypothetical protein